MPRRRCAFPMRWLSSCCSPRASRTAGSSAGLPWRSAARWWRWAACSWPSPSRWEGRAVRAAVSVLAVVVCGVLCGASQAAGGQAGATGTQGALPSTPPATQDDPAREWSFSAAVYVYRVVDDRNYAQPTFTVDRDWLHLEARYNYE